MKRNYLKVCLSALAAVAVLSSCSKSDNGGDIPNVLPPDNPDAYILNAGSLGQVLSNLSAYTVDDNKLYKNVYLFRNKTKIGDGANELLVYGSKMYFTVTKSNVILITDLQGKLLKSLQPSSDGTNPAQPRSLAAYKDYVYVSNYDGTVLQLDTLSMDVKKKVHVKANGSFLENEAVMGDHLYVAVSSRSLSNPAPTDGQTVVKLGLPDLNTETDIPVAFNAYTVRSCNDTVYVISNGNYGMASPATPPVLQKIDAKDRVTKIGENIATSMEVSNNRLLLLNSVYDAAAAKSKATFAYYDIKKGKYVDQSFLSVDDKSLAKQLELGYSMNVNPYTGQLYIGISDYQNEGEVFVFDRSGKYTGKSIKTGGMNPLSIGFLKPSVH